MSFFRLTFHTVSIFTVLFFSQVVAAEKIFAPGQILSQNHFDCEFDSAGRGYRMKITFKNDEPDALSFFKHLTHYYYMNNAPTMTVGLSENFSAVEHFFKMIKLRKGDSVVIEADAKGIFQLTAADLWFYEIPSSKLPQAWLNIWLGESPISDAFKIAWLDALPGSSK